MNAIAAHKNELKKLLENLSGDIAVSGITFVAVVDAYIARLDANSSGISASVNPPPAQIDGELTYGTNIDSKLRALLHATQNFKTARRAFPKISRCGPRKQAPDVHLRLPHGERSRRLALSQDNGRWSMLTSA